MTDNLEFTVEGCNKTGKRLVNESSDEKQRLARILVLPYHYLGSSSTEFGQTSQGLERDAENKSKDACGVTTHTLKQCR